MSKIRRKVLSTGILCASGILLMVGFQNCAPSTLKAISSDEYSNSVSTDNNYDDEDYGAGGGGSEVSTPPTSQSQYYADGVHNINGLKVRVLAAKFTKQTENTAQSNYDVIAFRIIAEANISYVMSTVRYTGNSGPRKLYLSKIPGNLGAECKTPSSQDAVIRAAGYDKSYTCIIEPGQVYYLTAVTDANGCSTTQTANSPCAMSLSIATTKK